LTSLRSRSKTSQPQINSSGDERKDIADRLQREMFKAPINGEVTSAIRREIDGIH